MLVYMLRNTTNGKMYVGKTVSKSLRRYLCVKRWQAVHGNPSKMPVVAAIAKHGWDKFSSTILYKAEDLDDLNEAERIWIARLDTTNPEKGYNLCLGGGDGRTGLSNSDEHNQKIGAANKGRKPKGYCRTQEHRQQLRDRMKGNPFGHKFAKGNTSSYILNETPEQKAKRKASIKAAWDRRKEHERAATG